MTHFMNGFADELTKVGARRGLKEIRKLVTKGETEAADALANVPGVLKPGRGHQVSRKFVQASGTKKVKAKNRKYHTYAHAPEGGYSGGVWREHIGQKVPKWGHVPDSSAPMEAQYRMLINDRLRRRGYKFRSIPEGNYLFRASDHAKPTWQEQVYQHRKNPKKRRIVKVKRPGYVYDKKTDKSLRLALANERDLAVGGKAMTVTKQAPKSSKKAKAYRRMAEQRRTA